MRAGRLAVILAVLLGLGLLATDLSAHRRDEYLQAARLAIAPGRVELQLDLTPGIAVADSVISEIDRDGDGVFSAEETQAYVQRVLNGISLDVDGQPLRAQVRSASFPGAEAFRRGEGTMQLQVDASLPQLSTGTHRLTYHNTHRRDIGVYLANALVPDTDRVVISAQLRDPDQRDLAIEYVLRGETSMRAWLLGGFVVVAVLAAFFLSALENPARAHHKRHAT
jgi:hypothetical protein